MGKMLKLLSTAFLIVCLATQAFSDCQDLTLDDCAATAPFETLKDLGDEGTCQLFCREIFAGVCTFFLYDREEDLCQLYDYDPGDYAAACSIIGATPTPKLSECASSTDECLQFTEGYCKYEGKLLENLNIPSGATGCQLACQYYNGDSPCDYFVYNDGDQNCQFLSSTNRTCDIIRGPPNPPLETCPEQPIPPVPTCPENWLESEYGCFYFANDVQSMTWFEAKDYCESQNSYLAEVLNSDIQDLLEVYGAKLPGANWWLGATDRETVGMWIWYRSSEPLDFTAWCGFQPIDSSGHCAHFLTYAVAGCDFKWSKLDCERTSTSIDNIDEANQLMKPICQKHKSL